MIDWFIGYVNRRTLRKREAVIRTLVGRGWMYGLDIVADSRGELSRGSVYVYLDMLERAGVVQSRDDGFASPGKPLPRRMYRLIPDEMPHCKHGYVGGCFICDRAMNFSSPRA